MLSERKLNINNSCVHWCMSYDDGAHSQQKCSGVEVHQISNEDCWIPSASATSFSNRVSFVIGLYIGFVAVYNGVCLMMMVYIHTSVLLLSLLTLST